MHRRARALLWAIGLLAGGAALAAYADGAIGDALCADDVLRDVPSPDGARRAVVFQRDCGATTGYSPQVSVLRPGQRLRGIGNVVTLDDDYGQAPAEASLHPVLTVRWAGARELVVTYDASIPAGRRAERVAGVRIRYEPAPAPRPAGRR